MTEPWIRVHANLASKPVIGRAVQALRVSENEAIGLMVRFWGSVSQHVVNGAVQEVTDRQIENWAGWTRKRGSFAAFIRSAHLDTEGRVNEWDDYHGKLEARRAKDRCKKQEIRKKSGGHPADSPQDIRTDSVPTRAVRDETIRTTTALLPPPPPWQPILEARIAERLTEPGRLALAAMLQRYGDKAGIVGELELCVDGSRGAQFKATWPQIDMAVCDFAAKYMAKVETWEPTLLRACIRRAMRPEQEAGNGRHRGGVGQRSYDNAMDALKDVP